MVYHASHYAYHLTMVITAFHYAGHFSMDLTAFHYADAFAAFYSSAVAQTFAQHSHITLYQSLSVIIKYIA